MAEDYYKILGVNKSASKDELKTAFRKLAHQHHPDKNKGDDKKFKEINEAYQTLSDDTKRAQYDRFGSGYQNMGGGGGQQYQGGFGGGFEGFDFSGFQGGGGAEFDLNDIFADFFGGARGYKRTPKGRDMQTEIEISMIDAILGAERKIIITGHKEIKISIPSGIHDGQMLKMTGMGEVIKDGKSGDLYIKVYIKVPTKISKKARELLEELKKEGI